jgi:hypothetical protein
MLDFAKKHEYEVNRLYLSLMHTQKLFWFHERPYFKYQMDITDDSWNHLQFVSLDKEGKVTGFIAAQLDRINNIVTNLLLLNFGDPSMTFTIDCLRFVDKLKQMNFAKIGFSVVIGNPAETIYDAIVKKLGGEQVGIFRRDLKLPDGNYYDRKFYEIQL